MTSICIDGFNLALPKGSGIATYGRNLAAGIQAAGHSPSVLYGPAARRSDSNLANLAAIADGPPPKSRSNKSERWRRTLLSRFGHRAEAVWPTDEVIWPAANGGRPTASLFWAARDLFTVASRAFQKYQTVTPVAFRSSAAAQAPQLMHWTCPLPLYARGMPNLVTVHDLIPLRLPHTTADDTTAYLNLCRAALDRADHVVAVSEQTRRDVIELLGFDERRVTNTYQAVDLPPEMLNRTLDDVVAEIEGVLGLGWREYFLYFGAVEPKKNLCRIIEGHLASGVSTPLVIVGGRGWLDADETSLLDQLENERPERASRVRRFPYMPFPLLMSLVRGARGVVFPSLYEGFGLPVLEAMLLGSPVITSTAGSLPEIAGQAALSVDPYDVVAIRDAIRAIDADEALRDELIARGRLQAARFSREVYRERLEALYARFS